MLSGGQREQTVSASHVLRASARKEFFRSVVFFNVFAFALYIAQGPWVVQNLMSFMLTFIPLVPLSPSHISPVS